MNEKKDKYQTPTVTKLVLGKVNELLAACGTDTVDCAKCGTRCKTCSYTGSAHNY